MHVLVHCPDGHPSQSSQQPGTASRSPMFLSHPETAGCKTRTCHQAFRAQVAAWRTRADTAFQATRQKLPGGRWPDGSLNTAAGTLTGPHASRPPLLSSRHNFGCHWNVTSNSTGSITIFFLSINLGPILRHSQLSLCLWSQNALWMLLHDLLLHV